MISQVKRLPWPEFWKIKFQDKTTNSGQQFKHSILQKRIWPEGTKLDYSISLIIIKQVKGAIPDCVLY